MSIKPDNLSLLLKISLPVVLLLLGIIGTWWLIVHKAVVDEASIKKINHEPPTVTVTTAKPEAMQMDVVSQGVVTPKTEIALVSEISGKVVKVHPAFAAGGYFKQGEMLLAIDSRDYEFAVIRAKAAIAEAYQELLREREEALQAESEWQALGSGKATDFVLHKPQLKERQAKLAAAEADLGAARLQLERCRLVAPFDGWVRDKRVSVGQYLNAGETIAQIYADTSAEVRLPIPSDQLEFLTLPSQNGGNHNGSEVVLTANVGSTDRHWQGRIMHTTSSLDDKNALLYAIAEIPGAFKSNGNETALMPGVFVHAMISGIERFDLLSLPKSALFGGNQVFSVDNHNKLKLHQVDVIRTDQNRVIVSKGISQGELIMIAGIELPIQGMRVKIKPDQQSQLPVVSVKP
jgi:membrane fusion protein, multidrug efflux system